MKAHRTFGRNRRNHYKTNHETSAMFCGGFVLLFAFFLCTTSLRAVEPNDESVQTPNLLTEPASANPAKNLPPPSSNQEDSSLTEFTPKFSASLIRRLQPVAECQAESIAPLANLSSELIQLIEQFELVFLTDPNQALPVLSKLERTAIHWIKHRKVWTPREQELDAAQVEENPIYLPSRVALEEIQLNLERHIILWQKSVQVAGTPIRPVSNHFDKGLADLQQLENRTRQAHDFFMQTPALRAQAESVGKLWADYLDLNSFLKELETTRQALAAPNKLVSTTASIIPPGQLVLICDRSNITLNRLDGSTLTDPQRRFLNAAPIIAWKEELARWTADTVTSQTLLTAVDRYEAFPGMTEMEKLSAIAARLIVSPSKNQRQLGEWTKAMYGNSNFKLYISKVLINHLLPSAEKESVRFREVIQGQPVYGQRQTETSVEMSFVPDPEKLLLSLGVKGNVATNSRTTAFGTTLFNRGQAQYIASKRIELTENGFQLSPCVVRVNGNRLELRSMRTDFDGIPILSNLVRGIVRNQYEARKGGAWNETYQKIFNQVKNRVDREASERFNLFNEKFQDVFLKTLSELDLEFEKRSASTEEHWLLTSWAIHSDASLTGNTPAPETVYGAFADIKVHESLLNTLVGQLEIGGRKMTVGECRQMLAERFHCSALGEPGENDDVQICFAAENPIAFRFVDGLIELEISIKSLKLLRQTHRDFKAIVRYKPAMTPEGKLVLEREGIINLVDTNARFVLLAVFGKIFPAEKSFPMTPKFLATDPRFDGLTMGQCRIEKGWFAIALVGEEPPKSQQVQTASSRAKTNLR